jgi:phosphoribosylaminoimidazole-succinocarboxamide synthase
MRSSIEGLPLLHRGKVRETYAVGDDRLLLVATDRISAFDVVFDQPIPDKGRLLTQISAFWFALLADLGPTHFLSADASELPPEAQAPELAGRTTLARRAERIDAECVVRGYLAGSGWAEYQRSGSMLGHALPADLHEADDGHERDEIPGPPAGDPRHPAPQHDRRGGDRRQHGRTDCHAEPRDR